MYNYLLLTITKNFLHIAVNKSINIYPHTHMYIYIYIYAHTYTHSHTYLDR